MKNNRIVLHGCCLIVGALMLSACSSPAPKLPHVKTEIVSHVVTFREGSPVLYPSEQDALSSFASTVPVSAVSYVGLVADDSNSRAVARARNVRAYLLAQGWSAKTIHLQPVKDANPLDILVNVEYARGIPPQPCPDWSGDSAINHQDVNASNFGCASNTNLILQMADPADYNRGHGAAVFDGTRDSVAVQHYFSGAASAASGSSSGSSGSTTSTTTSTP